MNDNKVFSKVIGNDKVKTKLEFFLDGYKVSGFFPPVLLSGAKGNGKTLLSTEIGKNLINFDNNQPKKFIKVNGLELKKKSDYFDNIVIPLMKNEPTTLFIDEAHAMGDDLFTMFLEILSNNEEHFNTYFYNGIKYDFDLKRHSFIFASSEPQKLLDTLTDRLEHIEVADYTVPELAKIVKRYLKNIEIDDELLNSIATVSRGNARGVQKISEHINTYSKGLNLAKFDANHWKDVSYKLSINPYGLSELEIRILKTLKNYPNISLTKVAAITGLSREAIRLSYETFLLKNNLMQIQVAKGRALTDAGYQYLESLEKA